MWNVQCLSIIKFSSSSLKKKCFVMFWSSFFASLQPKFVGCLLNRILSRAWGKWLLNVSRASSSSTSTLLSYSFCCYWNMSFPYTFNNSECFFPLFQMDRTLQLAPTMYHQTEAMLAFMKKFSWKYFSMVTTRVVGSEDFFSALRRHERLSRQQSLPNKYGHTGFEYVIRQWSLLTN